MAPRYVGCRHEPRLRGVAAILLDDEDGELRRASDDHDRVAAAALPATAKPLLASESLIRSVSGLLLTTANLAEVVSGAADERAEGKDERGLRRQRVEVRGTFVEQQPNAEPASADELTKCLLGERHALTTSACPARW